jgi:hypothetical protein
VTAQSLCIMEFILVGILMRAWAAWRMVHSYEHGCSMSHIWFTDTLRLI